MGQNDACQLGNWRFKKLDFGCWGLILGGWVLFSQAQTFEILNEPRRWDFLRKPMIETTIIESVVGNIFPCDFFGWCFVESWDEIMNKTHAAYLADGWWLMADLFTRESWGLGPRTMDDHSHLLSPRFSTRLRSNGFKAKSVAKTSQFLSSSRLAIHLSTMSCQRKSCSTFNHQ